MLKYPSNGAVSALEPRSGTAYQEICATARELKADLIDIRLAGCAADFVDRRDQAEFPFGVTGSGSRSAFCGSAPRM